MHSTVVSSRSQRGLGDVRFAAWRASRLATVLALVALALGVGPGCSNSSKTGEAQLSLACSRSSDCTTPYVWLQNLTVDATGVYWAAYADGIPMSVPVGGGTPAPIAPGHGHPNEGGIVVDGANIYWTDDSIVMKAPITGGGTPATLLTAGLAAGVPRAIAVDATSVYVTDFQTSGRVLKLTPK